MKLKRQSELDFKLKHAYNSVALKNRKFAYGLDIDYTIFYENMTPIRKGSISADEKSQISRIQQ